MVETIKMSARVVERRPVSGGSWRGWVIRAAGRCHGSLSGCGDCVGREAIMDISGREIRQYINGDR